jgi:tetratricopeptide (TPR) repeat protein
MNKTLPALLLVILIPLTHLSHRYINKIEQKKLKIEEVKYNLPSPEITKVASIGYDSLIADLLWLQLIQYVGGATDMRIYLPELYSLINNIVTLEPKFEDAYVFGTHALSFNKDFDRASEILLKGIKANPDKWYLPYQLGFLYYIHKKNNILASKYLNIAGDIEGSPTNLKKLAAVLYSKSGSDIDIKISLWQEAYERSKKSGDKINREKAFKNVVELTIERDLETIRKVISKYNELKSKSKSNVVYPDNYNKKEKENIITSGSEESGLSMLTDLKQLVEAKLLTKVPFDPFNRPYLFDAESQTVTSFPLPWSSSVSK